MVELQSCASLVNDSALSAIGQEVKGDSVNVIAEISAQLQRERQRNAELMDRISLLEAQIQERDKESLPTDGQRSCLSESERLAKFKRQKIEITSERTEDGSYVKRDMALKAKNETDDMGPVEVNPENRLVTWMSMDETHLLHFDKLKDSESTADLDDTDNSDDDDDFCEENDTNTDNRGSEPEENLKGLSSIKEQLHEGLNQEMHSSCLESVYGDHSQLTLPSGSQVTNKDGKKDCMPSNTQPPYYKTDLVYHEKEDSEKNGECQVAAEILTSQKEAFHSGPGSTSMYKRPPKVPFCPKEVKRILDSDALLLKNAQSHTIRKIIVFASLGIRHGCEDMYDLDFSHFSILRKGEAYVSPKDPGEHVLYENPGVRRKVFYPNRENPTLCPIQILEEEKAMRPSDPSCPSCLFLCIKYGGRTRNLPQNEYVRQRMGRNKLKSFGPVTCRMAMLVHIRSGSFFFKALGITLLFMAGFPDDLVQRETKYRNLDLLQKYYRTDEEAEGEELFLLHPLTCETQASPGPQQSTGKQTLTKSRGKKQMSSSKPHSLPRSSIQQHPNLSSLPPSQFGMMGYTSIRTHSVAAFQSMTSQTPAAAPQVTNPAAKYPGTDVSYQNQTPYHMFPPQPANAFMPVMYWPPPRTIPPGPYPPAYGYQSFPSAASYISFHPQPYYNHGSCSPFIPKIEEGSAMNDLASEEDDSGSDSSSSSTELKEALPSCKK